jgi:hypothetical protein
MSRVWNGAKINICKGGCGNDKNSVLKLLLGDTHEES